jgi:prepilin-type N-terminal cleavage/methylation domain-containing protein
MKADSHSNTAGFTLVEIMIVVAIIGLLAALALPAFAKARRKSMVTAFVEDARILTGAIQIWAQNNGGLPGNGPTGGLPVGMTDDDFKGVPWSKPTPLGGRWDFDSGSPCNGCNGALTVITPTDANDPTWQEVDAMLDDGDLMTGNFRIIRGDRYSYVFEP